MALLLLLDILDVGFSFQSFVSCFRYIRLIDMIFFSFLWIRSGFSPSCVIPGLVSQIRTGTVTAHSLGFEFTTRFFLTFFFLYASMHLYALWLWKYYYTMKGTFSLASEDCWKTKRFRKEKITKTEPGTAMTAMSEQLWTAVSWNDCFSTWFDM